MNLLVNDVRARRVQAAHKFAAQFNPLEWKYLCSHEWFLTGVGEGLDSGDFFPIRARAEKVLVDGKIRKQPLILTIDTLTPSWFGYL